MKTNNIYKACVFLIVMSMSLSCVQGDDFKVPTPGDTSDPAAGITANITIPEVKELFSGYTTELVSGLIVEGYVVSSDASGNFYKELYIQDHPSAPTAGIRLALDKKDLYLTYDIGRKLFINLKGLFIGEGNDDVITVGQEFESEIAGISEIEIPEFVIKSATVELITGKPVLFSEITDEHTGMYMSIPNTQIHANELGLPFVDANAFFSSQRTLKSCEEDALFILETSAYSDFSQLIVPNDKGTISGIVTRDYSGDNLILVLNEASDMAYGEERCAEVLDCGINIINGENTIFEEDFEGLIDENDLYALGWTNTSINGFGQQFENISFEGNTYMSITVSGTGENPLEAWLITPAINLDGTTGEELTFDIETGYDNGKGLTVLITDNYTGNPETTEWRILNVDIPVGPSEDFSGFLSSASINISCLEGDVHIAFRYQGTDPDLSTIYHIDNIMVKGN